MKEKRKWYWLASALQRGAPFHSNPRQEMSLGVVEHLRDDIQISIPAERSRNFWEVLGESER